MCGDYFFTIHNLLRFAKGLRRLKTPSSIDAYNHLQTRAACWWPSRVLLWFLHQRRKNMQGTSNGIEQTVSKAHHDASRCIIIPVDDFNIVADGRIIGASRRINVASWHISMHPRYHLFYTLFVFSEFKNPVSCFWVLLCHFCTWFRVFVFFLPSRVFPKTLTLQPPKVPVPDGRFGRFLHTLLGDDSSQKCFRKSLRKSLEDVSKAFLKTGFGEVLGKRDRNQLLDSLFGG